MKRLKKFLSASKINAVVFTLVVGMLLYATVGATYAAIDYLSSSYGAEVQMNDIGVSLLENGERISWRDYRSGRNGEDPWETYTGVLFRNMLDSSGGKLQLGVDYPEALSVYNSGSMNTWVRVTITKYWQDPDGTKRLDLKPEYIDLNLLCDETGHNNGWLLDRDAASNERTVLYYHYLLHCDDEESRAAGKDPMTTVFSDTLTISPEIASIMEDGKYVYDGVEFCIEVHVDVVQEHNGAAACESAWGKHVTIEDELLTP